VSVAFAAALESVQVVLEAESVEQAQRELPAPSRARISNPHALYSLHQLHRNYTQSLFKSSFGCHDLPRHTISFLCVTTSTRFESTITRERPARSSLPRPAEVKESGYVVVCTTLCIIPCIAHHITSYRIETVNIVRTRRPLAPAPIETPHPPRWRRNAHIPP
jgi:hypothetical protein